MTYDDRVQWILAGQGRAGHLLIFPSFNFFFLFSFLQQLYLRRSTIHHHPLLIKNFCPSQFLVVEFIFLSRILVNIEFISELRARDKLIDVMFIEKNSNIRLARSSSIFFVCHFSIFSLEE